MEAPRDPDMEARVSGPSINEKRKKDADDYYRSRSPEDKALLTACMQQAEKGKDFGDEMYSALALKRQMVLHFQAIDTFSAEKADEYYASMNPAFKVIMFRMMKPFLDNESTNQELQAVRELRELQKADAERKLLPRLAREGDQ